MIFKDYMNVNYINPFINASINVFKTFADIDSEPGPPTVRSKPGAAEDINGFIELDGHGINGYFIIHFSKSFLNKILAILFDGHTNSSQEEAHDLAGELTNMITGNAKAELSKKGFFFDVAVPRISHTTPIISPDLKNNPVIIVPFDTRAGKFNIEASIRTIEEDLAKDTISVEKFSKLSGLSSAKIKNFLRSGFLKGCLEKNNIWRVEQIEISKFKKK